MRCLLPRKALTDVYFKTVAFILFQGWLEYVLIPSVLFRAVVGVVGVPGSPLTPLWFVACSPVRCFLIWGVGFGSCYLYTGRTLPLLHRWLPRCGAFRPLPRLLGSVINKGAALEVKPHRLLWSLHCSPCVSVNLVIPGRLFTIGVSLISDCLLDPWWKTGRDPE